jgi:hypothetical protein
MGNLTPVERREGMFGRSELTWDIEIILLFTARRGHTDRVNGQDNRFPTSFSIVVSRVL